jgi:hypothetical protein
MEPFHPLAADADASPEDLALAQGECAFALGRLDGLLAGLADTETALFCAGLLRETLLSALSQAGFADAELRFDSWFAGLGRAPQQTPLTPCSAHAVVRALLGELGRHPWQPLAEAAQTIARAARFVTDGSAKAEDQLACDAITAASRLVTRIRACAESPLPFAGLSQLGALLRQDTMFAPLDREHRVLSLAGRDVSVAQTAPRTPLWVVDARLGLLLAACGSCRVALPFPGAVSAEGLRPHLWPNERGIVEAGALAASTQRIIKLIETSRSQVTVMRERLSHLRSSARAPRVWMLLAGFAPLGLDQLGAAFGVSRRGTYAVGDALVAAGMARRETIKGKVMLMAEEPHRNAAMAPAAPNPSRPSPVLAEFDAAMADIDRLLAKPNTP